MWREAIRELAPANFHEIVQMMVPTPDTPETIPSTACPPRIRTAYVVVPSILLAMANAYISFIAVALAIPGSPAAGRGFMMVATTFLLGNLSSFLYALFSSGHRTRRRQILGLVLQFFTVPICFGVALLLLTLFSDGQL